MNPPLKLQRLFKVLEEAGLMEKSQLEAEPLADAIEQTGVEDESRVRSQVSENRKLLPHEVAELIERYRSGATLRTLAMNYGLHTDTVRAHLNRSNVIRRPVRVLTKDQEMEAIRLYIEERMTMPEVGLKLRVSAGVIRRLLIRRNIPRRARGQRG